MIKKLSNQVAIVTGASSGIGAGIAKAMASAGSTVVVNYPVATNEIAAQAIVADIIIAGGAAIAVCCNVANEQDVIEMFKQVITTFGTVDILVNNAGLQRDAAFTEMTLEQWNTVIEVNLTGQFLCAREAIKEFIKRGIDISKSKAAGKIICMSSVHEMIPWAGHANYAASKGGINMMMKSIAQEFAPQKIRINSICPGAIKTPINKSAWDTPDAEQKLLTLIPYKRVGVVDDIAKAAVWLASDESDYINGASIYVDGGMTLFPGFATNG
jgi:glucose 1-dehydrogenase